MSIWRIERGDEVSYAWDEEEYNQFRINVANALMNERPHKNSDPHALACVVVAHKHDAGMARWMWSKRSVMAWVA